MKRSITTLIVLGVLVGIPMSASGSATKVAAPAPTVSTGSALVELAGDPLSVSARTRPAKGKKIDFNSASVKSERARLAATRNDFKQWLRANAPNARITNEFDIALHAVGVTLNGTSLETLRSAPLVRSAELQEVYRPTAHDDPDLSLVHANEAWTQAGGEANAGAGVKVAIIDSGIDDTHPCFDDAGYPAQTQLGDHALTNNKVIVAKVFSNNAAKDGFDAEAIDSHGTHVAGTVGCNAHTPAIIDGVDIPYDPSGVAPRALLGNYNVFPGDTGSARSEDILDALEEAYADGFDVANMSLGGARNDGGGAFLLDNAIDNLDRANMVVAVAAGQRRARLLHRPLPGCRSARAHRGRQHGRPRHRQPRQGRRHRATRRSSATSPRSTATSPLRSRWSPIRTASSPTGWPSPATAARALPDLTGKIALLGRGVCDFTVKMRNAQNAGAVGVIMVNRIAGEAPFVMSHNGLEPQADHPGRHGQPRGRRRRSTTTTARPATLRALGAYVTRPEDTNLMAGFSS